MKNLFVLIASLLFITSSYSQITVGPGPDANPIFFTKKDLPKFLTTTTIFVLPSIYEGEVYEDILKRSWTVTPYKLVNHSDFNIEDYINEKYSFCLINYDYNTISKTANNTAAAIGAVGGGLIGAAVIGTTMNMLPLKGKNIECYFEFFLLDNKKILKKINKNSDTKPENNIHNIITNNKKEIAKSYLYYQPKLNEVLSESEKSDNEIKTVLNTTSYFHNFQPGLFLNTLQKIDTQLKKKNLLAPETKEYKPELIKLKTNKLYIPTYVESNINWLDSEISLNKYISNYKFEYKFIDNKTLDNKILNEEGFYYLRFYEFMHRRYLQIVKSNNGDVIYQNFYEGTKKSSIKALQVLSKTIENID